MSMYAIASFYRFVDLDDLGELRNRLLASGRRHGAIGTISIAREGINATIAAAPEDLDALLGELRTDERFAGIAPVLSTSDDPPFLRLRVRIRREIITMGIGVVDHRRTARRVPPGEWNDLIADPSTMVIDTRNAYEVAIGTFEGAIDPGTDSFSEFPGWAASAGIDHDTPIAMFCTGGIRCEKATAHLASIGFTNLHQLEGGILGYLGAVDRDESRWRGSCYVFDRRVAVGHGLVPESMERCPNCDTVLDDVGRRDPGYREGVTCGACHRSITPERRARFAERQRQIDLADERGTRHLGRHT